jgi:hypothetical protein
MSFGGGGWTIRFGFLSTSIATAQTILTGNVGSFGLNISISSSKLQLFLSSTGSSWDIANAVAGNTTFSGSTWYDVELTYDPVAGKYFTYVNGVAEALLTITSSAKLCPQVFSIGLAASGLIGNLTGFEIKPYCAHPNGTTFTPQTTLASVSAAGYSSDFYDIISGMMYGVTAASASAGTNPTLTAMNVVYGGEQTTNASAVTATVNYAYQGKYVSADTAIPGAGVTTTFNANIGALVVPNTLIYLRNITAELGYTPGAITNGNVFGAASSAIQGSVSSPTRNTLTFTNGNNGTGIIVTNASTGGQSAITAANWKIFVSAQRAF